MVCRVVSLEDIICGPLHPLPAVERSLPLHPAGFLFSLAETSHQALPTEMRGGEFVALCALPPPSFLVYEDMLPVGARFRPLEFLLCLFLGEFLFLLPGGAWSCTRSMTFSIIRSNPSTRASCWSTATSRCGGTLCNSTPSVASLSASSLPSLSSLVMVPLRISTSFICEDTHLTRRDLEGPFSAMQIRVLTVRDQPAVDERHHVVDARLVVNDQVYVRGSLFQDFNCRIELRPSCGLFRSRDHSVAVEWVPLLHPHSPPGPPPSVVLWVRCTSIRVRLDWVVDDFRGRLVQV
eukprot:16452377-Heterocapsa_arctica.AAC.1